MYLSQGAFPGAAIRVPAGMPVEDFPFYCRGMAVVLSLPCLAWGLCKWGRHRLVVWNGGICKPRQCTQGNAICITGRLAPAD